MYNYAALATYAAATAACYALYDYIDIPHPRAPYVIKNLVKGFGLAMLLALSVEVIADALAGTWHNAAIHRTAALYVCHDTAGLLRVDLPLNTRLHHLTTSLLVLLAFGLDFATSPVAQAMFVYTVFSSCAFLVNIYLALRLFGPYPRMRRLARAVFALCCAANWLWHAHWFRLGVPQVLYALALLPIVRDDLVLLEWLSTPREQPRTPRRAPPRRSRGPARARSLPVRRSTRRRRL